MMVQAELIQEYKPPPSPEARSVIFLARDFPASYVRGLDELIHPPYFAASFGANPTDSSMWATYGASHTGVCLKFKAVADSADRPVLSLNCIRGFCRGNVMEAESTYFFALYAFY